MYHLVSAQPLQRTPGKVIQPKKVKEIKEEVDISEVKEKRVLHTEFKCSCGVTVIIESDDPKMHNISCCSGCLK